MSEKDAIRVLKSLQLFLSPIPYDAVEAAIEALQKQIEEKESEE